MASLLEKLLFLILWSQIFVLCHGNDESNDTTTSSSSSYWSSWLYSYLSPSMSWSDIAQSVANYTLMADKVVQVLNRELCSGYYCSDGYKLVHNKNATTLISNGCGSYGYTIPSNMLPLVTSCCDRHDHCYGTCGRTRESCEDELEQCILKICDDMNRVSADESIFKGCQTIAYTFAGTSRRVGCFAYLETQKDQCQCVPV
uniref:Group XIIA secretory phospholipase A2 n=1 Tax=Romanomermis culicivorax TaxID=13658 RepID=A0A915JWG9_ROMCU